MKKKPLFSFLAIILMVAIIIGTYTLYQNEHLSKSPQITPQKTHTENQDLLRTHWAEYASLRYQTLTAVVPLVPRGTTIPALTLTPPPGQQINRLSADGRQEVYIPAGEFWLGSNENDPKVPTGEKPGHTVYLDAYWIDLTSVTNQAYTDCVNAGICQYYLGKDHPAYFLYTDPVYTNFPVIYVTWEDARIFCAWVGGDLPTEAQWEKAARGPTRQIYPWGNNTPTANQANVGRVRLGLVASGSLPDGKSYYGVLDMGGNVREWVLDWYRVNYYKEKVFSNPLGPSAGRERVLKGAAWNDPIRYSRAASRLNHIPESAGAGRGFRCAYTY